MRVIKTTSYCEKSSMVMARVCSYGKILYFLSHSAPSISALPFIESIVRIIKCAPFSYSHYWKKPGNKTFTEVLINP